MSKERLEELLNDLPSSIRHSGELEPLKQFMREQAKRVQELECLEMRMEKHKYKKQNKRYREALEFYAEQDNYEWETSYRPQQEIDCMVIDDGGHTARKALEGEE